MDRASFLLTLPRKRVAAGAVIRDEQGRVCLVKGNYRPDWHFPGGTIEADESPATGCEREIREELGLDLTMGRLLCVGWVQEQQDEHGALQFIYDGGVLDAITLGRIVLPAYELTDHRFVTVDEAAPLVSQRNLDRLCADLDAIANGDVSELDRAAVKSS